MKKLFFMLAVIAMIAIASCNNTSQTELKSTSADSTAQCDSVKVANDTIAVK